MLSVAPSKHCAPRNRTVTLSSEDHSRLLTRLTSQVPEVPMTALISGIVMGNCYEWAKLLPPESVDLLFLDPPYNLDKNFNGKKFSRQSIEDYTPWLDEILVALKPLLKPTATIYICGDWLTSISIFQVASKHFVVRNRITWE